MEPIVKEGEVDFDRFGNTIEWFLRIDKAHIFEHSDFANEITYFDGKRVRLTIEEIPEHPTTTFARKLDEETRIFREVKQKDPCDVCPCSTPECSEVCFEEPFSQWLAVNYPDLSVENHLDICENAANIAADAYAAREKPIPSVSVETPNTLTRIQELEESIANIYEVISDIEKRVPTAPCPCDDCKECRDYMCQIATTNVWVGESGHLIQSPCLFCQKPGAKKVAKVEGRI
jgi:hypothetical protein